MAGSPPVTGPGPQPLHTEALCVPTTPLSKLSPLKTLVITHHGARGAFPEPLLTPTPALCPLRGQGRGPPKTNSTPVA